MFPVRVSVVLPNGKRPFLVIISRSIAMSLMRLHCLLSSMLQASASISVSYLNPRHSWNAFPN